MTAQFQSLVSNENGKLHHSFMEAWIDMFNYVNARFNAGTISLQELETAIWIEIVNHEGGKYPIYFYDARDRAFADGWTKPE